MVWEDFGCQEILAKLPLRSRVSGVSDLDLILFYPNHVCMSGESIPQQRARDKKVPSNVCAKDKQGITNINKIWTFLEIVGIDGPCVVSCFTVIHDARLASIGGHKSFDMLTDVLMYLLVGPPLCFLGATHTFVTGKALDGPEV